MKEVRYTPAQLAAIDISRLGRDACVGGGVYRAATARERGGGRVREVRYTPAQQAAIDISRRGRDACVVAAFTEPRPQGSGAEGA